MNTKKKDVLNLNIKLLKICEVFFVRYIDLDKIEFLKLKKD